MFIAQIKNMTNIFSSGFWLFFKYLNSPTSPLDAMKSIPWMVIVECKFWVIKLRGNIERLNLPAKLYMVTFHSYFISGMLLHFSYKDLCDPGQFTCYTLLYNIVEWLLYILTGLARLGIVYLDQLSGARHTHISYHNRKSNWEYL